MPSAAYTKNSFSGGLNQDIDKRVLPADQYYGAINVCLDDPLSANTAAVLSSARGTTNDGLSIFDGATGFTVIGVAVCKYKINGSARDCLTVWTVKETDYYKIWCYDIPNNIMYELYREGANIGYLTEDRYVDWAVATENDVDILYFVDNFNEPRKLRCEFNTPWTAGSLTVTDLSLTRYYARSLPSLNSIAQGGGLLSGTYQVAYQLLVPSENKYSKWSALSNPIHIYSAQASTSNTSLVQAGIGLGTTFKFDVNITLGPDESTEYTHFRLGVVEGVGVVDPTTFFIKQTESISAYNVSGTLTAVPIISNGGIEAEDISMLAIDRAPIKTARTVAIKNGRLLLGNVTYKTLDYDRGTPTTTGGSVIKLINSACRDAYADHAFSSRYKGHFRDETYRYALSYFDEHGNHSAPRVIDLNGITNNTASALIPGTGTDYMTNYAFDDGLTGWSQINNAGVGWIASPLVDNCAAAFAINTSVPTDILYQAATVTAGDKLVISYDILYSNGSSATAQAYDLKVEYYNGGTPVSTETILSVSGLSTSESTRRIAGSFLATVPGGTVTRVGFSVTMTVGDANTGNAFLSLARVTRGARDMRFPSRSAKLGSDTYSVMDSSNNIQALGLQITGINNHPTWSKGFKVLRAKRVKKIQYQSPFIPMMEVSGPGAVGLYPSTAREGDPIADVSYTAAQPMGPSKSFVPMNLYFAKLRRIETLGSTTANADPNYLQKGEVKFGAMSKQDPTLVYPQDTLYTTTPYTFNNTHRFESVDAVTVTGYTGTLTSSDGTGIAGDGNSISNNYTTTFYCLQNDNHYYDSSHSGGKASLRTATFTPINYLDVVPGSDGAALEGHNINKYNLFQTSGITWGTTPTVQAAGVVCFVDSFTPINHTNNLSFTGGSPLSEQSPRTNVITPAIGGKINTIEVVNCINQLGDDRYGPLDTEWEYIFTGTQVTFTAGEVATVQASGSLAKTVDVWGGDCFVAPHLIAVQDSAYAVTNQTKHNGSGESESTSVNLWRRAFRNKASGTNPGDDSYVSLPVPLDNLISAVQIVLESEHNGTVMDVSQYKFGTAVNGYLVKLFSGTVGTRQAFMYNYNANLSKQNDVKIWLPVDRTLPVNTKQRSRIVYSDQKVFNTSIEGFDSYPVDNFLDLDGSYGALAKLVLNGDALVGLQERAVQYIPVGSRLIEATDASQLAVRSGDVLGQPSYISVGRGCNHAATVKSTPYGVFFVDQATRAVCHLVGSSVEIISDKGMKSRFTIDLTSDHPSYNLTGIYDPTRAEYWVSSGNLTGTYVYNIANRRWISKYTTPVPIMGEHGLRSLYVVHLDPTVNYLKLYKAYSGNPGRFGTYTAPSVSFSINPTPDVVKVFDDVVVNASDRLDTFGLVIERESGLGNQTITTSDIDVSTREEGNYRVKILRDGTGKRARGMYGSATVTFNSGASYTSPVKLASILTRYRQSY
jgi:hypothetical protein